MAKSKSMLHKLGNAPAVNNDEWESDSVDSDSYVQPKDKSCKVDYLSLTWSCEEILQIKSLAKAGARFKGDVIKSKSRTDYNSINREALTFDANSSSSDDISSFYYRMSHCEDNAKFELRKMLAGKEYKCPFSGDVKSLGKLVVDTSVNYNDSLNNLRDNMGLDLMDVLCSGEVDRFVNRLNHIFTNAFYQNKWTVVKNSTGRNNYTYSASLMADGVQAGLICWGGRNLGCFVSFSGVGCEALDLTRLYKEIKHLVGIRITRIDLAHDDFKGKKSVNLARKMAKQGLFCPDKGRPPSYMYIESGNLQAMPSMQKTLVKRYGLIPDKGKSIYFGSRTSGKLLRIYEKGKQMGNPNDKWVRWELELHNQDRIIPLDAIINPAKYLKGAYPALNFIKGDQEKIGTIAKKYKLSIERCIENHVKQSRKAIKFMTDYLQMKPDDIVHRFTKDLQDFDFPSRLRIPIPEDNSDINLLHQQPRASALPVGLI